MKKEKKPLTEEQRIKRNKMIAIPCMCVVCGLVLWFIFSPPLSSKDEKSSKGFNMEMPDAEKTAVEADKRKAYSQEELANKQKEKARAMNTLGEYMSLTDSMASQQGKDFDLMQSGGQPTKSERQEAEAIRSSAEAYQTLNTTLGGFYEQPRQCGSNEDAELRKRLDELETSMMQQENKRSNMDEQVALMEKSYQLAAKYMPGGNGKSSSSASDETVSAANENIVTKGKMAKVTPVRQVQKRVVSSLSRPMSNEEFVASYSEKASARFNTAIGKTGVSDKNTISACIHGNQTITDGQAVRLRLLEAMRIGEREIPRNSVVVGAARLQGERLGITLKSIEHNGMIIPTDLAVYDNDGQEGIFIPKSMEVDAAKEVGANMGSSLNSSINISSNAGAQLASDLGKGVIQGVSQYISKKMRIVKIHLKAGYKVMLYQEED